MSLENPRSPEGSSAEAIEIANQLDAIFGEVLDADQHARSRSIEVLGEAINYMSQNNRERLKLALAKSEQS
jgi:hypothetical protein